MKAVMDRVVPARCARTPNVLFFVYLLLYIIELPHIATEKPRPSVTNVVAISVIESSFLLARCAVTEQSRESLQYDARNHILASSPQTRTFEKTCSVCSRKVTRL